MRPVGNTGSSTDVLDRRVIALKFPVGVGGFACASIAPSRRDGSETHRAGRER